MPDCGSALLRSLLILAVLMIARPVVAQPPPKSPDVAPKPSALRLPNGTVVFFTKNPDDPTLPLEGVLLSPKEYQSLLESAEQLGKLKDASLKALSPGACQIVVRIESRGPRSVAVLKFTIRYKTTTAKSVIALGGGKAQATAARLADGSLPLLLSQADGLSTVQEKPGDQTLELELEAPVVSRGTKGELGFEVGLPRAAITSLDFTPPAGISRGTIALRSVDRPMELQSQPLDFPVKSYPLGAAEYLTLSWTPPGAVAAPAVVAPTAEADLIVRTDEAVIETVATVRLRGVAREWLLQTPPGAEVVLQPTGNLTDLLSSSWLSRPMDAAKPIWSFRPLEGREWTLLVTSRQTRPRVADPKFVGPYPVGPISVLNATRQTGTVKLYAPRTLGLRINRLAAEFRPQDVPQEEDLRAVYRYSTSSTTGTRPLSSPWLELEARTIPTSQRVQPNYTFSRIDSGSASGWRIVSSIQITPPLGGEVNEVALEVPANWLGEEFGPLELISSTIEGNSTSAMKQRIIQLQNPQKSPFELKLTALVPAPLAAGVSTVAMPRFPRALERDAKLLVNVPEGLQLRGQGIDAGPVSLSFPLVPVAGSRSGAPRSMQASFEKGLSRVELSWQPYRPDLTVDNRAEITLQPRQLLVEQFLRLRTSEGDLKPFRLRGPETATGWNLSATVESLGSGEWLVRPPAETKDWTFTLSFAVPLPRTDLTELAVNLAWVELATLTDTQARVWGGGFPRRLERFSGAWRELPPEPNPERATLPWLTLSASGARVPLTLNFAQQSDPIAPNLIDRALIQTVLNEEGALALRARFVLKRWSPAGIEIEVPGGMLPEVLVDGRRLDPIVGPEASDGYRTLQLPVPPTSNRRNSLLLEIMLTGGPRLADRGWCRFTPPRINNAILRTSPRWLIFTPAQAVPLLGDGSFQAEVRWGWSGVWPAPMSAASTAELEQWLTSSDDQSQDTTPPANALSGRQPRLGPVDLWLVPRVWWLAACALVGFLVTFGLSRLRAGWLGAMLGLLATSLAAAILLAPQPATWLIVGLLPGILIATGVLTLEWGLRWYHLRRINHLPGFRRHATEADFAPIPAPSIGRSTQPHEGSGSKPMAGSGS